MKCIETTKLMDFIKGKLDPQHLIAMDAHISSCPHCKAAVGRLISKPAAELSADILRVSDCPEYEELSAFVDNALQADDYRKITAHINNCELCYRDVEQIKELRSKAALREKIVVMPGATRRNNRAWFPVWQRVLAGALVAGVAAVFAVSNIQQGHTPKDKITIVAANPDKPKTNTISTKQSISDVDPKTNPASTQSNDPNKTANNTNPKQTNTAAKPNVVLKDGRYQVIKQNGSYVVADASGKPAISGGLAEKIAEKLSTGGIKAAHAPALAVAAIKTRANNEGYNPPPAAPKLIGPDGVVIATNTPTFKWSGVDLANAYRLKVTDKQGNIVYDSTTSKTSITISPLTRGEVYIWQAGVRFNDNDDWTYSSAAKFSIISSDAAREISKIKRDMPGSHLALAVTYESLGLKDEAAHEYAIVKSSNTSSELAGKLAVK